MSEMNDAQSLRDLSELLQQLSEATGLSEDAIQSEVDKLDYASFQFNDAILVSPSDFESIIDSWAAKLKSELRAGGSATPAKKAGRPKAAKATAKRAFKTTKKATAKKSPAKKTSKAASKTPAKKSTKAAPLSNGAGSLPLPDDYRSVISHLYGPSLKRIMPADEAEQKKFLEAIANETDAGVELLNHLAEIIADKYTGKMAPESAYNGLKNKAVALLNGGAPAKKTRGRKPGRKPAAKKKPGRKPGRPSKAATAKKPESASTADQASVVLSEMELPKGYRKRVSNRYGPTLKNVLPEDNMMRMAYLREIVSESNLGKSFLERVADSIRLKYRGKITSHTAYQGLLSKAQVM